MLDSFFDHGVCTTCGTPLLTIKTKKIIKQENLCKGCSYNQNKENTKGSSYNT